MEDNQSWYTNGQNPVDGQVATVPDAPRDQVARINTAPHFDTIMREYIGRAWAILMSIDSNTPPSYTWPDVLVLTELLMRLEGVIPARG